MRHNLENPDVFSGNDLSDLSLLPRDENQILSLPKFTDFPDLIDNETLDLENVNKIEPNIILPFNQSQTSQNILFGISGVNSDDEFLYNFLSKKIEETHNILSQVNYDKSDSIDYNSFKSSLWKILDEIHYQTFNVESRKLSKTQLLFRGSLYNLFSQSLVFSRALSRPYGYPGDYIMLQILYNNKAVSRTRLGRFLDQFFFDDELAKAVVNRVEVMGDRIIDFIANSNNKEINILNIASGSGFELGKIVSKEYNKKIIFHCFDQELASLLFIKQNFLGKNKNVEIKLYKEDIRTFFKNWRNGQKFDLIYNIGLADYLPDLVLLSLTRESLTNLKEDGIFVLAHKDYLRFPYYHPSWFYNWNFIHRSLDDYKKLIGDSDIKNEFSIWFESDKKIVYFSEFK